jgi:Tol biopolymer transport system component
MGKRSLAVPFTFVALLTLAPKFSGAEGATSKIAFAADVGGAGDIFVVNSDGTGLANVTNSPISEGGPVWSPDGGSIACSSENGIWTMNADGSNAVNLINGGTANASPSWSPDGTKISFFSTRDHGWSDIFVMERDGSDPINLTPTEGHGGNSPAWSPDGQSIAFHGFAEIVDIFVMASDGSDLRNLTNNTARDSRPEWSPDGNLIAFHSTRDGGDCGSNFFVMNADGSQVRQLTTSPHCGSAPSWSPDGTRILFTSNRWGSASRSSL